MKCDKDCLNCKYPVCKYDAEYGKEYHIIRHKTEGLNSRLQEMLMKRHIRQCALAKTTEISVPTISAYVNGTRKPRADHIVAICRALNCSADWLLGLEK